MTIASKSISALVQVRESLCIKQNSFSHGRAFFPFLSLRRLFVSALGVPDGKVSSLEAAVLANYLTAVSWQSSRRPLKKSLSLPSEIVKTRNNFNEIFFVYFGNRSVGHMGDKRRYFPYRFHSIFIYNSINIGHRLTICFLLQLMDSLSLVDDLSSFLTMNNSAGEGFFPFITFHFKYLYGSYLIREALFMLKPHSPGTPPKMPRGALPLHLFSNLEEISSARCNQDLLHKIPPPHKQNFSMYVCRYMFICI